jgi:16S rRNA (cytidine1402-2'-O)-methyltransferase
MMATLYVASLPLYIEKNNFSINTIKILCECNHFIGESRKIVLEILSFIGDRNKPYSLLNEHTTYDEKKRIIDIIKTRNISVLFSDIGTPCVADPGYDFIDMCYKEDINILSLPGPSTITTCLSLSGFYAEKFFFAGYPPIEKEKRKNFFIEINRTKETIVFIERPYSMKNLMKDLIIIQDKRISISYNLGNTNETTIRGKISNIKDKLGKMPKAPFIVAIEGIK